MTLIDIYHIYSRPMWYNEATGEVIKDARYPGAVKIGFRKYEQARQVSIDGHVIRAYGTIYKV